MNIKKCSHKLKQNDVWRVGDRVVEEKSCTDCGRIIRQYQGGNESDLSGR